MNSQVSIFNSLFEFVYPICIFTNVWENIIQTFGLIAKIFSSVIYLFYQRLEKLSFVLDCRDAHSLLQKFRSYGEVKSYC